jgi:hypothetical protein
VTRLELVAAAEHSHEKVHQGGIWRQDILQHNHQPCTSEFIVLSSSSIILLALIGGTLIRLTLSQNVQNLMYWVYILHVSNPVRFGEKLLIFRFFNLLTKKYKIRDFHSGKRHSDDNINFMNFIDKSSRLANFLHVLSVKCRFFKTELS